MSVPTIGKAKAALGPYHGEIKRVIEEAFAEWRHVQTFRAEKGYGPLLYDRTKANDVFDGIARRAIPLFGTNPKINLLIETQTFKLHIAGIIARIKKGGDDNLGSNVPTLSASLFEDADGQIPGFPPETGKVEIIWIPNEIWTQIDSISVVARDGDQLIWEYEIASSVGGGTIIPIRPPSGGAPESDARKLVKPKAKPTKKPDKR